jgi:hypothetical protein
MRPSHFVWLAPVTVFVSAAAGTQPHRYPLQCARLTTGVSTDRDVRRIYGRGLFVPGEGHGGGRYFVDRKHRVTLHVEIGVYRVIEAVEYRRGVHLPGMSGTRVPDTALSSKLSAYERIPPDLHLGTSLFTLRAALGTPASDRRTGVRRTLRYVADYRTMPQVLAYEADFQFERDRLIAIRLYNGE